MTWGNRVNRKNAKTKYTLERVGVENFKAEVEKRSEISFAKSRPYEFTSRGDRIGWVEGLDGKHHPYLVYRKRPYFRLSGQNTENRLC